MQAQLVTEVIDLAPGWNAIWLNVDPEPADLDQLLTQQAPPLDCQAFWTFEADRSIPASAPVAPGRWFFYDKGVPALLRTLHTLQGHRAYLVKVNVGGQLRVSGEPVVRDLSFTSRVSNLFGTTTDVSAGTLTFEKFFSHPNALGKLSLSGVPAAHDIFSLVGNSFVRRNLTNLIGPNKAYWINVIQDFDYAGPVDLTELANGLSFGRSTAMRTLRIEVPASATPRKLMLQARPCAVLSATGGCSASPDGVEWLEYRDPSSGVPPVWLPLSDGLSLPISAEATHVELELRARRDSAAATASVQGGGTGSPPDVVIDVTDDQGSRSVVTAGVEVEPIFGRWIGRAELTRVSTHPVLQNLPLAEAEAPPLSMTLILDIPDPAAIAAGSVPRLLDAMTVQTFRDGRSLLRRFSSVLFDRPLDLLEDAGDPIDPFGATGTLHGTINILPEDPTNPYRHRYHPEHRTGYDITREITIQLVVLPPSELDQLTSLDATFGPHRLTGEYTEVITGVTDQPITVQGVFRLDRLIGEPVVSPQ